MQTKLRQSVFVGDVYETTRYGKVKVVEYNSATDVLVEFEDGKFEITTPTLAPMSMQICNPKEGAEVQTQNSQYLLGKPLDLDKVLVDNKDHIKETMCDVNIQWKAYSLFVLKDTHLPNGQRVHLTQQNIEPQMVANCICVGLEYFNNL